MQSRKTQHVTFGISKTPCSLLFLTCPRQPLRLRQGEGVAVEVTEGKVLEMPVYPTIKPKSLFLKSKFNERTLPHF
jgi:hypothetical protein